MLLSTIFVGYLFTLGTRGFLCAAQPTSLRLRRAIIPAYPNANVKKCSMGDEGLKYPCVIVIITLLKHLPALHSPIFERKTDCNKSN